MNIYCNWVNFSCFSLNFFFAHFFFKKNIPNSYLHFNLKIKFYLKNIILIKITQLNGGEREVFSAKVKKVSAYFRRFSYKGSFFPIIVFTAD